MQEMKSIDAQNNPGGGHPDPPTMIWPPLPQRQIQAHIYSHYNTLDYTMAFITYICVLRLFPVECILLLRP